MRGGTIAVAGKGGVGKTCISALIIRKLSQIGSVLAIKRVFSRCGRFMEMASKQWLMRFNLYLISKDRSLRLNSSN